MAKVLVVVDDDVGGGAFKVGERLALGMAHVHRIVFACRWSPATEAAREGLARAGVGIVRIWAHAGEGMRATWDRDGAWALLARTEPDRILFVDSGVRSSIAAKECARDLGVPWISIVNAVDGATPAALRLWGAEATRAANAANANVFVSTAALAEFQRLFPGVRASSLVVTNGVPDEFFGPTDPQARSQLRSELGVGDDEVMLLLPGRLEPRKGQHLALEALARQRARSGAAKVKLVLAGYGADEAQRELHEQIRSRELTEVVRYIGPRNDVSLLLDACDIVIMPSSSESDPLVSKEAMAKGRPVVASDLKAFREQGHDDALLAPAPEDSPEKTVAALALLIDDLSRDVTKRGEIGRTLHEIAERRYTMALMVDAYVRILGALPERSREAIPSRERGGRFLDIGRKLNLADPQHAALVLKDGWSNVESDGIWSFGPRSRLAFELERPASELSITMKLRALAAPGRVQSFEVSANGRPAASWSFANRKRVTKTIRIALPRPQRRFVIRLSNADPTSPFELGMNDDRRKLGLYVSSLRVAVGARRWRFDHLASSIRRAICWWRGTRVV